MAAPRLGAPTGQELTTLLRDPPTRERLLGPNHPLVAMTLFDLALTERRLGQVAVAESLYRRTIQIQRRALGKITRSLPPA